MKTKKAKVPTELRYSEAYRDNPQQAQKLWDKGFRPIAARDLKHGMVAASRVTLMDFPHPEEPEIQYVHIEDVAVNETQAPDWQYEVIISHTGAGGLSYEDPDTEVWVRK